MSQSNGGSFCLTKVVALQGPIICRVSPVSSQVVYRKLRKQKDTYFKTASSFETLKLKA